MSGEAEEEGEEEDKDEDKEEEEDRAATCVSMSDRVGADRHSSTCAEASWALSWTAVALLPTPMEPSISSKHAGEFQIEGISIYKNMISEM